MLSVSVYDASGNVLDAHTVLLTAPARMRLPAAAVTATIGAVRADGTAPVTLRHAFIDAGNHIHSTIAKTILNQCSIFAASDINRLPEYYTMFSTLF